MGQVSKKKWKKKSARLTLRPSRVRVVSGTTMSAAVKVLDRMTASNAGGDGVRGIAPMGSAQKGSDHPRMRPWRHATTAVSV